MLYAQTLICHVCTTVSMAVREQLLPFLRQRRQSLSVQFLVYVFAFSLLPGLARCAVDNNDSTTPLHVLYITSSGGGYDSSGTRPAVDMAIERINNDTAVLPEYTLNITEADSQCTRKGALDPFFTQLFESPRVVAAVGAGCSIASEALAEVAHYYNFSVVSYASSSEAFSDRQRFSSFFRTVPSESWAVLGVTRVIEEFGWNRAAIITQDEISFKLASDDLFMKLQERNISVVSKIILPTNLSLNPDLELFALDVRIIVLQMYSSFARTVICQFLNQELDRYRYVWIIPGWYLDQWWTDEKAAFTINCTDEQLANFLHRQRVLAVRVVTSDLSGSEVAVGGITPDEFKREYQTRVESTGREYTSNAYHAYDAVWAVAIALHNYTVQQQLLLASGSGGQTCSGTRRLEDFVTVDNSQEQRCTWQAIQSSLERVEFTGVSGYVMFEDGSRVPERLKVLQYRQDVNDNDNITLTDVAIIYLGDNFTFQYANNESVSTVWPVDIPHDGTPLEEDNYPLLGLTIFCYIFATAGSIFAAVCMVFTFIFRKRKLIRLTSPNLNYVVGFGVIFFNTAVYFFVFPPVPDPTLLVLCNIRPWFASLGYSLCFGTINAKMWRVFYIFHNPKPAKRKKVLKDWHLFVIVMIFVFVDVIILTVVSSLDGARFELRRAVDKEFPSRMNDDGITVNYFVQLCDSRWRRVWLGVLFGYKVVVQIIGVFLAFRIRKVTIKMLNDSKEISATLYLSSLILAAVILISFVFPDYLNVYGGSFALGIPTSSTVVLLVVFVSKMVRLYRDPRGENIFGKTNNATTGIVATNLNDPEKVTTLEKKVRDLTSQLSRYQASTLSPANIGRSVSTTEINGKTNIIRFNSEDILGNTSNLNNSQSMSKLA